MASLVTRDGRLLSRAGPQRGFLGSSIYSQSQWLDRDDFPTTERVATYEEAYSASPTVGAAINKLVRQTTRLPLKVYKKGSDNERERVIDHPLVDCLERPMPGKGKHDLKQWAILPLAIHGNALLAKWRNPGEPDGPPRGLLPVDWRYVEAYASQGGPVEMWGTTQTGEQRLIQPEQAVHFAWHSGWGEIGLSPLKQLANTIRLEDATVRHQTASFRNGVRPSVAVTPPEGARMNDPEVRNFWRAQIETLHKGVDQAGKVALMSPGAKLEMLQMSAADAQLIQQRYISWEEIQTVFDLAGPLLGDLRHGTYSNVTELNKQLFKSVLGPWLALLEDTLQSQLIDPEPEWAGMFVEFDVSEQIKGDPLEVAQALQLQIQSGTMAINEARQVLNLAPFGDPKDDENPANKPLVQANNVAPLDQVGQTDDPEAVVAGELPDQTGAVPEPGTELAPVVEEVAGEVVPPPSAEPVVVNITVEGAQLSMNVGDTNIEGQKQEPPTVNVEPSPVPVNVNLETPPMDSKIDRDPKTNEIIGTRQRRAKEEDK